MLKNKKALVWVVILTMFFQMLPVISLSAADDINIISSTSVTAEQAKTWAKSKKASDQFIALADLYWRYASDRGGINPAIAYVQAAKETGYGKFGGVITADYHNPCGLKTTTGGSDTDPNAHMKFENWDDGVQAHLDHLALYAGASGYPRSDTKDPRHFASVYGKAKTVKALGGNWAPSPTYGSEIYNLYQDLLSKSGNTDNENNNNNSSVQYLCIDTPTSGKKVDGTVNVRGWAINTSGVQAVKIYLDGKYVTDANYGIERPDVKNAYPSLSGSLNSGFSAQIDLSNVSGGTKKITVEVVGKDNTKKSDSVTVVKDKLAPIGVIDTPTNNYNVSGKTLTVRGWALNGSGIKEVRAYIDGQDKGIATYGATRNDVKAVYPNYPNADKSGYSIDIDVSNLSGGTKTLKVVQTGNDGSSVTYTTNIVINKLELIQTIDTPWNGTKVSGNSLTVSGWALNNSGLKEVRIYVNGKDKGTATIGISRPDVKALYSKYSNAGESGFRANVDISDIEGGNAELVVKQTGNDGTTLESKLTIKIDKLTSILNIDRPGYNVEVDGQTMNVSGWAIAPSGVSKVEVYLDEQRLGEAEYGLTRNDVKSVYPSYPNADKSGFTFTTDIKNISNGTKKLKVVQTNKNGTTNSSTATIYVSRSKPRGCIDTPTNGKSVSGDSLRISGWALNDSGIKEINIKVDGVKKGQATINQARPDVKAVYPSYSNAGVSGFSANIDVSQIAGGSRLVEVEQIGNDGSVNVEKVTINIAKLQPLTNIDAPGYNATVSGSEMVVSGWVLNPAKISKVQIYINDKYITDATLGLSRNDVKSIYSNYPNAGTSGFRATVNISNLANDSSNKLKVVQVAVDGTSDSSTTNLYVSRPSARICIDQPTSNKKISGNTLTVSGWALNASGVKQVKVYVDNKYLGDAEIGISRNDVAAVYPQYDTANKSGYRANVNISDIKGGTRTVKVEQIGNDGTTKAETVKINVDKPVPMGCIDTPASGKTISSKETYVRGWELNLSGIEKVQIYVAGKLKATTKTTLLRPDLISVYPAYAGNEMAGYEALVDLNDVAPGKQTIKVVATGNDGTTNTTTTTINIEKKSPRMSLDTIADGELIENDSLRVSGWALNPSGVQTIKVYIDGTVVSMPALNVSRQDILNIFPGYTTDANCGFNTHINISKLAKGGHNIKVEVIGVDGTTSSVERMFYYKEKPAKTIVVDPGHNPGNIDRGARVNGYDETELNMEIASKLRKELKDKGYNVILTRDFGVSMSFSTVTESLDYKVNVANLINADLFISIHQNSNDNPSAHGTEVYYSTNDSQYGYISSKESKVAKSSQLASKVVNNISSNTGFYNRGPKDANFYVVRHSKMPSILVECGFISNPTEGAKLSDSSVQTSIAKAITNGVGSVQI